MTTVSGSAIISAPASRIWEILTQLDRYADWESGYTSSIYTSEQREGVGTTRRVGLRSPMGVRQATHVVTRWDEGATIAWQARDTNFPFLKAAEQTLTLRPEGQATRVENEIVYDLKYGPLGSLMDMLMFKRTVRGAADGFLASLTDRARGPGPSR